MKNIFKIFARDFKKIFTNSMAIILAVGVAVLPSLYAWFNIYANWDPYGSTGNMQVAVVISDEGYTYNDITINVGDSIRSNLEANDSIDWQFVSKKTAVNGVKAGNYYAAIEIPKGFSKSLTSIMTTDFKQPQITYYANEKKNAIATKITDTVVRTVQTEVNESFVSTVVNLINMLLGTAVEDAEENGTGIFSSIKEQIDAANDSIDAVQSTLDGFRGVMELADDLGTVLSDKDLQNALNDTGTLIEDTQDTVELTQGVAETVTGSVETVVSDACDTLNETAGNLDKANYSATEKGRDALNQALVKCAETEKKVKAVINALNKVNSSLPIKLKAIDKTVAKLNKADSALTELITDINLALNSNASVKLSEISLKMVNTATLLDSAANDYNSDIKPQIDKTVTQLMQVLTGMSNLVATLNKEVPNITVLTDSLGDSVAAGNDMLTSLDTLLKGCKAQLDNLDAKLESLSDSELVNAVVNLTDGNSEELGEFIACPVKVNTEKVYGIENYGSAMAPFYSTLAIWVGAIVLVAIFKTDVRNKREIGKVNPVQEYFGRMIIFLFFALIQGFIICVGDLYFLNIQCYHPVKFILAGCIASLIYTVFIYSLVFAFGDIGKALAVIMLVVQIGGSGGTFPIDVTPNLFRILNPYLPFTFVIEAMRECVCGLYGNNYWIYILKLCAYLAAGLVIGIFVRFIVKKPIRFFNKRIEATGLF